MARPKRILTEGEFTLVIDSLKNGISIMQLAKDMLNAGLDFPTAGQIYDYCYSSSEIRETYMNARESFAHAVADDVVNIADMERDPQKARNRIQARQWAASKIMPKIYGDKLDLDVTNKVDIGAAVTLARARLSSMRGNQLIDVTPQSNLITTDSKSVVAEEIDPFS